MALASRDFLDDLQSPAADRRRFVVQHHVIGPDSHYDLMIEEGDTLATWRLPVALSQIGDQPTAAERIGPHRRAYLDYEGPVSGDRGSVRIHERGVCLLLACGDDRWEVEFDGARTRARVTLQRLAAAESAWSIVRGQP